MIAAETTSPTYTAEHEQHDHPAHQRAEASRSSSNRMLAGFSHHVLYRPLRAYQRLVGAVILASILYTCAAIFTVLMARQTRPEPAEPAGKHERYALLEAGLLARFAHNADTLAQAASTFRPQVPASLQRLTSASAPPGSPPSVATTPARISFLYSSDKRTRLTLLPHRPTLPLRERGQG